MIRPTFAAPLILALGLPGCRSEPAHLAGPAPRVHAPETCPTRPGAMLLLERLPEEVASKGLAVRATVSGMPAIAPHAIPEVVVVGDVQGTAHAGGGGAYTTFFDAMPPGDACVRFGTASHPLMTVGRVAALTPR